MEFHVDEPVPYIPDHLSVPQFIFDSSLVPRPQRLPETPYFIEEATGRPVFEAEVNYTSRIRITAYCRPIGETS